MYGALRVMVPILALTASLGAISPQTFRAQSDLVVLQAAVSGRSGAVSDLERQDFRLYEDGKPQEIRFFLNEDHPVAAGLVVDNSLSMRNKRAELIAAADAFALSSHPDDALFTVNFNERVWLGLPSDVAFTSDRAVLHDALAGILARGKTAMYDAIAAGLDHVSRHALEDRVLIVVSDGGDNSSEARLEDVLMQAQLTKTMIYTVGLFDEQQTSNDRRVLRKLAAATGGLAIFPEKITDVTAALTRVAHDIRHRYTLGYVSTNPARDGSFRAVRVVATDHRTHKPLDVRTRPGYLAARDVR